MEEANITAECKEVFANVKCIIFDLDGTLVNTIDDLANACDFLLKNKGLEPHWSLSDYKRFVGNGARLLVERAFDYAVCGEELEEQFELFKEKYNEIKLNNAYPYDGIQAVVSALRSRSFKLAVCTNKPHSAALEMVEALFGKDTFDVIKGAVKGIPKKPDPAAAKMIISELGVRPDECVWVGDSDVDIQSAKNLGALSIAVSWGFRSYESLLSAEPSVIIKKPENILEIFEIDIDNN